MMTDLYGWREEPALNIHNSSFLFFKNLLDVRYMIQKNYSVSTGDDICCTLLVSTIL